MRAFVPLFLLGLIAAPVLSMGCEAVVAGRLDGRQTVYNTGTPDAAADVTGNEQAYPPPPTEGGAGGAPSSPLCGSCPTDALPDDTITAVQCGESPDGGAYDPKANDGNALLACRVSPTSSPNSVNGQTQATATCSIAGHGTEGSPCMTSDDCASTFECAGAGVCRHYCCRGDVSCGNETFCDVQPITGSASVKVPVCMPLVHAGCTLLDPTSCDAGQTCSVVRADGTTACVDVGSAKAGDSCETDHCARDLVCLGFGATMRRCYQLCETNSNYGTQCPMSTSCQSTLPLFQDPSFGICQ